MLGISEELVVDGLKEVALVTVLTEEAAEVEATETFCNDLIKSSRRFSASLVGAGASLGLMGSTRVAVATASEVSVAGAAGVAVVVVVVFVDVFFFDDDSNLASASLFFRSRSFSRRTCD